MDDLLGSLLLRALILVPIGLLYWLIRRDIKKSKSGGKPQPGERL